MKHTDTAVYAEGATLLIEPSGSHYISVVAQGPRDAGTARASCVAAVMSLREATKARRALTRQIRALRARQAEMAS